MADRVPLLFGVKFVTFVPFFQTYSDAMHLFRSAGCLLAGILLVAFGDRLFAQNDQATPAGRAEHVVIVVWDGLRADSVDETATPTLAKFAREGTFFARHHSVYPTSTEVNGTAIATGCYPRRSGLIGNREYRPAVDPYRSFATEDLQAIRIGDAATGGNYLRVPTLAELAHAAGWRTATTSTKAVVLLQDRKARPDAGKLGEESVDLFSGNTLPESAVRDLAVSVGTPFPREIRLPNVDEDAWTTRALTQALWKDELPKISVLWLSEPDFSQHRYGPSSPQALKALASSDANLGTVLATLETRGWRDKTDVFVVSDHGFSTIGHQVDVARYLRGEGVETVNEFRAEPRTGQVLSVGLGGTVYLYAVGHDQATIRQVVEALQRSEFAGVIFTRDTLPGTLPLSAVHIDSPDAPDVAVALRWSEDRNADGLPGAIYADGERKAGQGTHATLSRYDLHNTLVANGPSFRRGFRDELPSANTDLAPTIASILGLPNVPPMDGRVLGEALAVPSSGQAAPAAPVTEKLTAAANVGGVDWQQYLQVTHYAGVEYFDEGNAVPSVPAAK